MILLSCGARGQLPTWLLPLLPSSSCCWDHGVPSKGPAESPGAGGSKKAASGTRDSALSEPWSCADLVVGHTTGLVPRPEMGLSSQFPAPEAPPLQPAWHRGFHVRAQPCCLKSFPDTHPDVAPLSPPGRPDTLQLQAYQVAASCLQPGSFPWLTCSLRCPPGSPGQPFQCW